MNNYGSSDNLIKNRRSGQPSQESLFLQKSIFYFESKANPKAKPKRKQEKNNKNNTHACHINLEQNKSWRLSDLSIIRRIGYYFVKVNKIIFSF